MKRTLQLFNLVVLLGMNSIYSAESEPTMTGESAVQKYYTRSLKSRPTGAVKGAKYGTVTGATILAGMIGQSYYEGLTLPNFNDQKIWTQFMLPYFALSAAGGAIAAVVKDAFRSTSVAWIDGLKKLFDNRDKVANEVMYVGIPANKQSDISFVNKNGKLYLLSKDFNNITNAFSKDHYELYIMPKDGALIDTFLELNNILKKDEFKNLIAFIAVRPTPGVTKLPGKWLHRNLPRIIIGFKDNEDKKIIKNIIAKINSELIMLDPLFSDSLNIQPRYSQKINNLIYVGYGSADYKDTAAGKLEYTPKVKSWYYTLFGPTDEQMAFSSKEQEYYPIK